jgi:hypothetical protein
VFGPASGRPDPSEQQAGVPPVPSPDPSSLPAGGGPPGVPTTAPGAAGSAGPDGAAGGTGAGPTAGPGGGTPQPAGTTAPGQPEPTGAPNPARRTVDTAGGSAVVECSGTVARLIASTPADGYQTQTVQAGPAPTVHVKFRAGNTVVSVQASCRDGVPDVTIR